VRQEFSIVLTARPLSGRPTPSSEPSEVRWVPATEPPLPTLRKSGWTRHPERTWPVGCMAC
jgi:hypothetical protein